MQIQDVHAALASLRAESFRSVTAGLRQMPHVGERRPLFPHSTVDLKCFGNHDECQTNFLLLTMVLHFLSPIDRVGFRIHSTSLLFKSRSVTSETG